MCRRLLAAIGAIAFLTTCQTRTEAPADPRNTGDIILITIDTWRADAAGFAGNARVKTPFLDSLARRGIVFANAHAHSVVTLPSHANILTGLNPYQHGVRENAGFVLDPSKTTVAEILREIGYATGAFVGALPLDARYGLNQGFDLYDDNYGKETTSADFRVAERSAAAVLSAATKWWQSVSGRKRFMWIHLYDPHAPYMPVGSFAEQYRDNPYLGEVAAVDKALFDALASINKPQTLFIVTSDHGEALGDHGELTHGLFAYEATLRVPLIVAGEGIAPRSDPTYARHIDIVPTILDWIDERPRETLPGQSLLIKPADRETYFEALSTALNRGWAPLTGVIRNGAKYIDLPIPEFYDLASDPREERNIFGDRRRDIAEARKILEGAKRQVARNTNISSDEAARLRSLGYLAGGAEQKSSYTAADDPKTLIAIDRQMHEVVAAYERGDLPQALAIARSVVAARPDMIAGRELLALTLQQSERLPEAIEQLRIAVKSGRALPSTKATLALLLTETGRSEEAIDVLRPLAAAGDPDVLNAYGIALADRGDLASATAQFERVLKDDANNAPAHQNLGVVALRKNDVLTARDHLDRALALNPRLALALNTRGVLAARDGELQTAVTFWQRAVDADPRQYDALYNIALVHLRAGRQKEARVALERFVTTAPRRRYADDIAAARQTLAMLRQP